MQKEEPSVLALGNAALDVLTVVECLPQPDEKIQTKLVGIDAGGPAATAAATTARLGISASLAAAIGDDEAGRLICELNKRDGIDISLIEIQPSKTSPVSIVIANQGKHRSIIWSMGMLEPYTATTELKKRDKISTVLLLDGREMQIALDLTQARRGRGALTMLDAGTLRVGMLELAEECQMVGMSHKFASQLIGEFNPRLALEKLRSLGAEYAIVTAGADGCWGLGPDGIILHQPIFPIEVVDSTGAGDIFHGAWAAALLKGLDWRQQLRYASGAAALGCRFPGGRAGIPTWTELKQFINKYPEITPVEV
jgi:sulfofructose kinase